LTTLKVGKLRFRTLEIDGRASISADLSDDRARGIYAYEFSDGMWYVGKSVDVRARHVQHMHDYRHEEPPRVPVRMLWAEVAGDERQLDYAETQAIAWFEKSGYQLTNVMKTGRPRGDMQVVVDTGTGWGVPIPWERENLPASTRVFRFEEDASKKAQFDKFRALPEYGELLAQLRRYVGETVPAPADTAGTLWVATAMPSTGRSERLCCISCQNAETLVVLKGDAPNGFANVKRDADGKLPRGRWKHRASYGTLPDAYRIDFRDLDDLDKLLGDATALDCCYRANAELMRRGASMYRRFNNPYLVEDILRGI